MSKRSDNDTLHDIHHAIQRIMTYVQGITYDVFLQDLKTQDAVIRNLEIIGEATKNLSNTVRSQCDDIPWRAITGMRDKLIHDYFGVNIDIVWHVVTVELSVIAERIAPLLDKE
jgi:uncharacterized protein with HEPN domain